MEELQQAQVVKNLQTVGQLRDALKTPMPTPLKTTPLPQPVPAAAQAYRPLKKHAICLALIPQCQQCQVLVKVPALA